MNAKTLEHSHIILLHGLGRSGATMKELEAALREIHFSVHNLTYPSRDFSIPKLALQTYQKLQKHCPDKSKPTHFITHSLGSIIVRYMIATYRPQNIGRIVMIGPPNQGSGLVDVLKHYRWIREFYGPAAEQLSAEPESFTHQLRPIKTELGVIAGDKSKGLLSKYALEGPNDGVVTVESTKLPEMKDHIVLHRSHTALTRDKEAIWQTLHFLAQGEFDHNHPAEG